jgi:hypothetical protein
VSDTSPSAASSPVVLSVMGTLRMGLSAGDTELRDFGAPKSLSVVPDPRGADLVLRRRERAASSREWRTRSGLVRARRLR